MVFHKTDVKMWASDGNHVCIFVIKIAWSFRGITVYVLEILDEKNWR